MTDGVSLTALLALRPRDAGYRDGCMRAIRLAAAGPGPSLELDELLASFVRSGPQDRDETDAFLALVEMYEENGLAADAREVCEKVLARFPGHPRAMAWRAHLAPGEAGATALLPELPDLPDLPDPADVAQQVKGDGPGAAGPSPFAPGTVVGRRYVLRDRLGVGGHAIVFRAEDLDLGGEVALKLFKELATEGEAEDRFKREVRLSRQISHRNVIRLFDIGYHAGFRYVSMELLVGADLRRCMEPRLALPVALEYLAQACDGVQAAHELGVVHRDVKPENCFVTGEGVLKVMDFGLAKMQSALGVTTTGIIAGTPAYMAPEQIRNFSLVGPSADIYAVGVMAYEMLAGCLPFRHQDPMSILMMHLEDTPEPLRRVAPSVPEELENLVMRLLAKDPAQRLASCALLAARLREIQGSLGDGGPAVA